MQDYEFLDHESPRSVFVTDGYQGLTNSDSSSSDGSGTSNSAPLWQPVHFAVSLLFLQ